MLAGINQTEYYLTVLDDVGNEGIDTRDCKSLSYIWEVAW